MDNFLTRILEGEFDLIIILDMKNISPDIDTYLVKYLINILGVSENSINKYINPKNPDKLYVGFTDLNDEVIKYFDENDNPLLLIKGKIIPYKVTHKRTTKKIKKELSTENISEKIIPIFQDNMYNINKTSPLNQDIYKDFYNNLMNTDSFFDKYFNKEQINYIYQLNDVIMDKIDFNNDVDILSIGNSLYFPFYVLELFLLFNKKTPKININTYPLSQFSGRQEYLTILDTVSKDIEAKIPKVINKLQSAYNQGNQNYKLYVFDYAGTSGKSLINFMIVFNLYLHFNKNISIDWLAEHVIPAFVHSYVDEYNINRNIGKNKNMLAKYFGNKDIFGKSIYIDSHPVEYIDKNIDTGRCILRNTIFQNKPINKDIYTHDRLCMMIMFVLYMDFMQKYINGSEMLGGKNIYYYKYQKYKKKYLKITKN